MPLLMRSSCYSGVKDCMHFVVIRCSFVVVECSFVAMECGILMHVDQVLNSLNLDLYCSVLFCIAFLVLLLDFCNLHHVVQFHTRLSLKTR